MHETERTLAIPRAGTLLSDTTLRVVGMVGGGELGIVMLCDDEALLRQVAVKFLRPDRADPRRIATFLELSRATARVTSPNVVAIYDVGLHEGLPFVVMEHIPGVSLVDHRRAHGGALRTRAALAVTDGILRGLEALHDAGIVHGAMGASNVLVSPDGRIVLTDAGMANVAMASLRPSASSAVRFRPQMPEGMDPRSRDVGAATDVCAVASMAYELVTGQEPSRTLAGRLRPPSDHLRVPGPLDEALVSVLDDPTSPLRAARMLRLSLEGVARRLGDESRTPAVLLVGQDGTTLATVEASLGRLRRTVEVSRATSARMALLALRTTVIDLIVFVPDVPDLGAPELLSSVRALPSHGETPIVVAGADGTASELQLLERYGASCVLPGDVRGPLYAAVVDAELDASMGNRGRRGTYAYPG